MEGDSAIGDCEHQLELQGTSGTVWTTEEQAQLEELLARFPATRHPDATQRYLLIASGLSNKTARDVALRAKWMSTQDMQRKRKPGEDKRSVKALNTKLSLRNAHSMPPMVSSSRPGSSGNLANLANLGLGSAPGHTAGGSTTAGRHFPPVKQLASHSSGNLGTGTDSGIQGSDAAANGTAANGSGSSAVTPSGTLGRAPGTPPATPMLPPPLHISMPGTINNQETVSLLSTLMEHNSSILAHIRANMSVCKVVENLELLVRYRDNISAAFSHMASMTGVMQQMPPLPVQPNWELALRVLPPSRMPMPGMGHHSMMPMMMMPPHNMMQPGPVLGPSIPMMGPGMMPQGFPFPPGMPAPFPPGPTCMPGYPYPPAPHPHYPPQQPGHAMDAAAGLPAGMQAGIPAPGTVAGQPAMQGTFPFNPGPGYPPAPMGMCAPMGMPMGFPGMMPPMHMMGSGPSMSMGMSGQPPDLQMPGPVHASVPAAGA